MLATAPPSVTLRTAPMSPFDGAIAAARTCYSPRVIGVTEVTERQRDSIGRLTFDGGHHTVYQHAHFEFGIENISRQFVWTFLHSYPFYNSEQSSQRYVKLKEPRAFVPPIAGEARDVYETAILRADGTELPVHQTLLSVGSNEEPMLAAVMRDISLRKREELERFETANGYEAAIRASAPSLQTLDETTGWLRHQFLWPPNPVSRKRRRPLQRPVR